MSRPTDRRLLAVAALLGAQARLRAQTRTGLPEQTIRVVVPYPLGGATDVIGRVIA